MGDNGWKAFSVLWVRAEVNIASTQQRPAADWIETANRAIFSSMMERFKLLCSAVVALFQSRASPEAENLALRHQLGRRPSGRRFSLAGALASYPPHVA